MEQVRGPGARLGWAFGVTVSIVAWGYLVWLAIDFGRTARDGDSSAWWMLGLAALGAVACLFVALLMVARLMEDRTAAEADEAVVEETAVLETASVGSSEPEPTVAIAEPTAEPTPVAEPVAEPTPAPITFPKPAPAPAPAATVGPVMSTQVSDPVPYVGRRAAATPAEDVPPPRQEPHYPVTPAAHHGSSYPGAGKRSAGRHAGPGVDRPPTVVPPGVAGKRRANV